MQIINYFLASIISYLGIALGIILIYIAPEEQKHGKGYFLFLRNIFFMLILLFLLFFYYKSIFIVLFVVISLIVFLSLNKKLISGSFKKINKISDINKSLIAYTVLAIIFYLSYKNINLFIIESSLIFLYGVANASLLFNLKGKNYLEILLKHILFVIVAIALFLLFWSI